LMSNPTQNTWWLWGGRRRKKLGNLKHNHQKKLYRGDPIGLGKNRGKKDSSVSKHGTDLCEEEVGGFSSRECYQSRGGENATFAARPTEEGDFGKTGKKKLESKGKARLNRIRQGEKI